MRTVLAALPVLLLAGGAAAASLDIVGTYGSPAGCKYAADGQYGDESVVILDAEHYENFVTHCSFVQVLTASDGSKIVTLLCGHEGDEALTVEMARIAKAAQGDAYAMFSAQGDLWDEVSRCGPVNDGGR